MRRVAAPEDDPGVVFRTCVSIVKNVDLRTRLLAIEPTIVAGANFYRVHATAATLHVIPQQNGVGAVSTEEMIGVYELRMAKKGTPGRALYDRLMAAPQFGRCPLCGQRIVSTIDHHLPKSLFPGLAVVPINLVPACGDCNKAKLAVAPTTAEEQLLHPYFDDVEGDMWLYAEVIPGVPVALRYFVECPPNWPQVLAGRIGHHFRTLGLGALYASHSGEELVNIQYSLRHLFASTGADGVRSHLTAQADSYFAARRNSWQTAMYSALAQSEWFCTEGAQ